MPVPSSDVQVSDVVSARLRVPRSASIRYAAAWAASRGVAVFFALGGSPLIRGDVHYYWQNAHRLVFDGAPLQGVLPEYPVAIAGLLAAVVSVARSYGAFTLALSAVLLVADAAFTAMLWRAEVPAGGSRRAVRFWIVLGLLLAPFLCARLDVLPAVAYAAALWTLGTRPRRSGSLLAVGAGLKVWPAFGLPLLAVGRSRSRALTAFAVTGLGIALLSAVGGLHRLVSPLTWQSGRGLQVESLPATPFMVGASTASDRWTTALSRYNAWEVSGAGVGAALEVARILVVVPIVIAALLAIRHRGTDGPGRTAVAWCGLAVVSAAVAGDKVFSPQYVLWIGASAAVLLCAAPHDPAARRVARLLVATAALTTLTCPFMYAGVERALAPAVATLALRNALLLWVAVCAVRHAWTARAALPADAQAAAVSEP